MGPRFWFLADSIRLKSFNPECVAISLNRWGTLGLTGQEARVEDQIYILNVYLTKFGNLKVSSNLLIRVQLFLMSKVGLRPQQADMKGRVAVRT